MSEAPQTQNYEVLSGLAAYAAHAKNLVAGAHTELILFSHDLDHRVYGSEEFCDTLKKFILQHRRARLRAIVHSPGLAMRKGHRLVELGRMLSSRIEFRQLPEEQHKLGDEYLLADSRVLLYKEYYSDIESRWHAQDPLKGREQLRRFESLWPECTPAREFTDLKI